MIRLPMILLDPGSRCIGQTLALLPESPSSPPGRAEAGECGGMGPTK